MLTVEIYINNNWQYLDTDGAIIKLSYVSPLVADTLTPVVYTPPFTSSMPDTPRNRILLGHPNYNATPSDIRWATYPVRVSIDTVCLVEGKLSVQDGIKPCNGIPIQIVDNASDIRDLTLSEAAEAFPDIDMLDTAPDAAAYIGNTITDPNAIIRFPPFLNEWLYSANQLPWYTDILGGYTSLNINWCANLVLPTMAGYNSTDRDLIHTPFPHVTYFLDFLARYHLNAPYGLVGAFPNEPEVKDLILYSNYILHDNQPATASGPWFIKTTIEPKKIFTTQATVGNLLDDLRMMFGLMAYTYGGELRTVFLKDLVYKTPIDITPLVSPLIQTERYNPPIISEICWGSDKYDELDSDMERSYSLPHELVNTEPTRWTTPYTPAPIPPPPNTIPLFNNDYYDVTATNEFIRWDRDSGAWMPKWGNKIPCYTPDNPIDEMQRTEQRQTTGLPMFMFQNRETGIPLLEPTFLMPTIKNVASSDYRIVNTGGNRPDHPLGINPFGLRYTIWRGVQPTNPDNPWSSFDFPLANYVPYDDNADNIGNLSLRWEHLYQTYTAPYLAALKNTDVEVREIRMTALNIKNFQWGESFLIKSETPQAYLAAQIDAEIKSSGCIMAIAKFIKINQCT